MPKNDLERDFEFWLSCETGIPPYEREFRFHPTRRWRFDFAWPDKKVAVEIDGLLYDGQGGHQSVRGYVQGCEKYEAALNLGWRVYTVPGPWVVQGSGRSKREVWRPEVMDTLRNLLNG